MSRDVTFADWLLEQITVGTDSIAQDVGIYTSKISSSKQNTDIVTWLFGTDSMRYSICCYVQHVGDIGCDQ